MPLIDFTLNLADTLLNLAALLLWFNWRSNRFDPLAGNSAASLVGTLKRADPQRWKGWRLLAALLALLLVRSVVYWMLGSSVNWTPRLNLIAVVPSFRSNFFWQTCLFSFLSFGRALVIAYFWILALLLINRRMADSEPIHRMLRLHVGPVARCPWPIQLLLPLLLVGGLWVALNPLAVRIGLAIKPSSVGHLVMQGLLVGAGTYLTLKYLIPLFLILYILASYVYLGSNPFWDFVSLTARNLLVPLRALPLRIGRWDLAPVFETALVLSLLAWPLPTFLERCLDRHHFMLWPR